MSYATVNLKLLGSGNTFVIEHHRTSIHKHVLNDWHFPYVFLVFLVSKADGSEFCL